MTISSQVRTAGPYAGNDSVATFPFAFKVFLGSDLRVALTDVDGNVSSLVLSSDFTAFLNGDQDTTPGGTITLLSGPLPTGCTLNLTSGIDPLQPTALTNQGGFFPKVIERGLDRLTILLQQQLVAFTQGLRTPFPEQTEDLPAAARRADRLLSFDSAGNPIAVAPVSGSATDLALILASDDGTDGIGFKHPAPTSERIELFNIILQQELTPQRIKRGAGGGATTDDTDVLLKTIAYAQGDGHKNFRLAQTGFGYRTETDLVITGSNLTLNLDDHLFSKQTTKSNCLVVRGTASVTGESENVSIIGSRPVFVDGNAPNITGYNYLVQQPLGDAFYSAVTFQWTKNFVCENVWARGGLVNSLRTYQARGGVFRNCRGSGARWDNGISVDFDPQDFDIDNPDTWSNVVLIDCTGDRNTGFGLTSYGATGTLMMGRIRAYLNGNNDPTINPGPGGGISFELNGSIDHDYHGICENAMILGNLGRGVFISATGTKFIGRGSIERTRIPAAYSNPERYGNGAAIFGAKGVLIAIPISNSERYGVFGLAVNGRTLGVELSGSVSGSAQCGALLQGVDTFRSSGEFRLNGLAAGATAVDAISINNTGAPFNQGAGRVDVTGRFDTNGGSAVRTIYVSEVRYHDIDGKDSNVNHAPQSAVFADNCDYVEMTRITHRGANVPIIANAGGGNARAMIDGVTGDATVSLYSNSAVTVATSTKSSVRQVLGSTGYPVTLTQYTDLQVEIGSPLTGSPVINLNTTNPTNRDLVRFTRKAASTGSLLTITDGTLTFTMAAGTTADVQRTSGGTWVVTSMGTSL